MKLNFIERDPDQFAQEYKSTYSVDTDNDIITVTVNDNFSIDVYSNITSKRPRNHKMIAAAVVSKDPQDFIRILDNGGETMDRYTVVYLNTYNRDTYQAIGMSDNPRHPCGIGQHIEVSVEWSEDSGEEEIDFSELSDECQKVVLADLANMLQLKLSK